MRHTMFRNTAERYGCVAIFLHWAMAALIGFQFTLGFVMTRTESQRLAFDRIQLHKSIGISLLALTVIRVLWRLSNRQPLLPGMGPLEGWAARLVHALLYVALFLLPLTGWALVSASVLDVPTMPFRLFVLPHLPLEVSEAAEDLWAALHRWIGWLTVGLVVLHALAALRHHFWLRDDVLVRMLGWSRRE